MLGSALKHSRPVYIELPRDMVAVDVRAGARAGAAALRSATRSPPASTRSWRVSRSAKSPVLMVDVEVRRYGLEAKVAELARRLGLPVVTSFMGRGLLADADAPLVGTYLGVAGSPEITRLVEDSDGLLLLGVIVSDTNFAVSERAIDLRRTIQALDGRVTHRLPHLSATSRSRRWSMRCWSGPRRARAASRSPGPITRAGWSPTIRRSRPTTSRRRSTT